MSMTALRTSLHHARLAARAEMEGNRAKHLVYARAAPPDALTRVLAMFYESQRAAAAEQCDALQEKLDAVPF